MSRNIPVSLMFPPCSCLWPQMALYPRGGEYNSMEVKALCVPCQLLGVIEYFERSQYIRIGIWLVPHRSDLSSLVFSTNVFDI